jgi:hypothetical protein
MKRARFRPLLLRTLPAIALLAAPGRPPLAAADPPDNAAAEVLARAAEAVSKAQSIHVVYQQTVPGAFRSEEWQLGDLYRRDAASRYHFFLGPEWAVSYDEQSNIAIAARRRSDDEGRCPSAKLGDLLQLGASAVAPGPSPNLSILPEGRVREGRPLRGIRVTRHWKPQFPDELAESVHTIWIEEETWRPVAVDYVSRDSLGTVITRFTEQYQYNLPLSRDLLSWSSVLQQTTVVIGWEHLHAVQDHPAIAIQSLHIGPQEITVEARSLERLPNDHLLVTGCVERANPEWLGAHITIRDGRLLSSYRLVQGTPFGLAPWGWGSTGPARQHFYMVFSLDQTGWGPAVPSPTLTFRAWGLNRAVSAQREETTFTVQMNLPVPTGKPVAHELQPR